MLGDDFSIANAVLLILTLFTTDIALSYVKRWSPKTAHIIDGVPTVLVTDGKYDERALRGCPLVKEDPSRPWEAGVTEGHQQSQFQGWDLIAGRMWPQIGGNERYLDIIGVNYYFNNQWIHGGPPIDIGHPLYKPLSQLLTKACARYGKPILIAEPGIEGERRGARIRYVSEQARIAMQTGVPLEGICLYPIVNHPGWDDGRHCQNGLLSADSSEAGRFVDAGLSSAIIG